MVTYEFPIILKTLQKFFIFFQQADVGIGIEAHSDFRMWNCQISFIIYASPCKRRNGQFGRQRVCIMSSKGSQPEEIL